MSASPRPDGDANQDWRTRLALLIGQALALGVSLSILVITANALFLPAFGAQALPYVYLLVAVLGTGLSYAVSALQRRYALSVLAMLITAGLAAFFGLAWLLAGRPGMEWVSFALIASFPLFIQIGFVFLGGQAGRLLDVRQIKRYFPMIVAGFVAGFLIGALVVPALLGWLASTENLLLPVLLSTLTLLLLLFVTYRRFPAALRQVAAAGRQAQGKSFLQLLKGRFVLLLFLFQALYAVVNQFSDYLLLAQAGQRYTESAALAQFFSNFGAVLNTVDLFILTVVAGGFLSRFGLGVGLVINPLFTGLLYLAAVVAGIALGPASLPFFLLIVIARIANITVQDGATRGSVNAAYQALPDPDRGPVQTGAEGIGQPLALGLVGAALLVFNQISGLTQLHITLLTLGLALVWALIGWWVYRDYAAALLQGLKRRALNPAELSLADGSSLAVAARLARGERLSDVRLALDLFAADGHPSLDEHLLRLAASPDPALRSEAFERLEQRRLPSARPLLESAVRSESSPAARAAALRALCALLEADALPAALPHLKAADAELRLGALVGLLRYGGINGILAAGQQISQMEHALEPGDRKLAARAIGELAQPAFYQPLLTLLNDPDPGVRCAALGAAGRLRHPRLIPQLIANLADPASRAEAAQALLAHGPAILPSVAQALAAKPGEQPERAIRLVRLSGQVGGPQAIVLLKEHLAHPDDELRGHILAALSLSGYQAPPVEAPKIENALRREAEISLRQAHAQEQIGAGRGLEPLQRALQDEASQARRRAVFLLSFLHDSQAILKAGEQLQRGSEGAKALALETLDVTLPPARKALALALLAPAGSPAGRIQQLSRALGQNPPVAASGQAETALLAMLANLNGEWPQPWLQACAAYAAGKLGLQGCRSALQAAQDSPHPLVRETAAWASGVLAGSA